MVSLLPSATEIVAALGFADILVGRSHECDFPREVERLPACTEPKIDVSGATEEIHRDMKELLARTLSVYRVDAERLRDLSPTHIVTQIQCEVCAVSLAEVEQAIAGWSPRPTLVALQARRPGRGLERHRAGGRRALEPPSGEPSSCPSFVAAVRPSRRRREASPPGHGSRRSNGSRR